MTALRLEGDDFALSAQQYAQQGWAVLPLKPRSKAPCLKGGYQVATTNFAKVSEHWRRRPSANVGITTGDISRLIVLDVDPKNGGNESLNQLLREHGPLPETLEVRSGGGGRHYYFRLPEGTSVRGCVFAKGLDLKANGGYIVAPPSVHPDGGVYEWDGEPLLERLAPAPGWLCEPRKKKAPNVTPVSAEFSGAASETPLGQLFDELRMLGRRLDDGKYAVICPWQSEHTTGKVLDSSTVIFPATQHDGLGGFHCSHSHCAHRGAREALRELRLQRATGEAQAAWRGELRLTKDGALRATFRNIYVILRNDVEYGNRLRFDELHGRVMLDEDEITDTAIGRFRVDLDKRYDLRASDADMVKAVQLVADQNKFHPVRTFLKGLQWDGVQRLDKVAETILRVRAIDPEEIALVSMLMRRWAIGLVGRPLAPGLKVDTALILQGRQGTGKSTFFRILAGDWFNDTEMGLDKDAMMLMGGAWICEWAELENVTGRNTVSRVKAFLTSTEDRFRPPFGRTPITVPRSSVVVGTTNLDTFLHDPTGSRRFWVIPVGAIDIAALREQREQLLAEAVHLFRSGEQHWLTPEEEEQRRAFAAQFADSDPWEERVLSYASRQEYVRISDVLTDVLEIETVRQDRRAERRVADILKRAGWYPKQQRPPGGKPQRVWLPGSTGTDESQGH